MDTHPFRILCVLLILDIVAIVAYVIGYEGYDRYGGGTKRVGYTNTSYHFSFAYPQELHLTESLQPFSIVGTQWRLYAQEDGVGLVEVPFVTIDQGGIATGKPYPLLFKAALRIGVSSSTEACTQTDAGFTEQKTTKITINGIPFTVFTTQDAAMMKYLSAESYRTVHNGMCFVIERYKVGSHYRDETMTNGTNDTTLDEYYDALVPIIQSFRFTR